MEMIFNNGDTGDRPCGLLCCMTLAPGMNVAFKNDFAVGDANSDSIRLDLSVSP